MTTMDTTPPPPTAGEMREARRLQKRTQEQLELVHKLAPELRPSAVKPGDAHEPG